MGTDFVETSAEAAVGGFQGIKKVRGLLVDLKKIPPRFTDSDYGEPKDQIEVSLEEAAILEMFPNADEFELKDTKFTCWIPYAASGKVPGGNSIYMKCFIASAEELGKKPTELKGEYVTLERQDRFLFKMSKVNKETGEKESTEVRSINKLGLPSSNSWCFVSDETADSGDVKEYIASLIIGKKVNVALRELATESRARQFPEFKEALKAGTISDLVDVELVDGKFVAKES